MRILISYFLKDNTADTVGGVHNFPNIEKAWDWFDSKRKDCVLPNGALVKASYTTLSSCISRQFATWEWVLLLHRLW